MKTLTAILLFFPAIIFAQSAPIHKQLEQTFDQFRETSIDKRRLKHYLVKSLLEKTAKQDAFSLTTLGKSIEGREINMLSIGSGSTTVLLWSQMHGDEPSATMALFDIFKFLQDDEVLKKEKKHLFKNLTIHFIPMLNPDGAELYQRRNALGIDINRDALRLQSPEGRILKAARDSLNADFGFNLHDQSRYYTVGETRMPATISVLAPAFNFEKDINEVRGNAMKVIVGMNNVWQKYIPGHVGRYSDEFEPRAFGDNIQKWGTSAILIESGGYPGDREKQLIRKMNYIGILSALFAISDESFAEEALDGYEQIPNNSRNLLDLKISNFTYELLGEKYVLDVGINYTEVDNEAHNDFYFRGVIADLGDLSTSYGYDEVNAENLEYKAGKVFEKTFETLEELEKEDIKKLLQKGYTYVRVKNIDPSTAFTHLPIHVIGSETEIKSALKQWQNPTFLLMDGQKVKFAVINGFIYDFDWEKNNIKNALILR
ncbi:M14 family metallopeptidase [Flammeovirgaceae bacterium SG7u.111]|nr:M14 family metallopeptidase [Flammeovirgaceae bacterium SG7u.132]WPO35635.1 M14 family metallopeptidase [Flammeovirgaceae bacterium SG7u.111]